MVLNTLFWQKSDQFWSLLKMHFQCTHLAAASWEFVVISIASCTDFCRESLVLWSTGSTDWMSMLVMTRLFWVKANLSRTLFFSSTPNTEARMILAEFWNERKFVIKTDDWQSLLVLWFQPMRLSYQQEPGAFNIKQLQNIMHIFHTGNHHDCQLVNLSHISIFLLTLSYKHGRVIGKKEQQHTRTTDF